MPRLSAPLLLCAGLSGLAGMVMLAMLAPLRAARQGGEGYQHGDWLINLAAGPVRRGPLGELILRGADLLGVAPMTLLSLLQLGLTGAALALMGRLVLDQRAPTPARARTLLLLATLPALAPAFWSANPEALFRKEIFALAALALAAALPRHRATPWLGGALMLAGMLGHEVNVLLLPAYLALRLHARPQHPPQHPPHRPPHRAPPEVLLLVAAGLGAGLFALAFSRADPAPICDALLARALPASLCDGAIGWLAIDPPEARRLLADRLHSAAGLRQIVVLAVLLGQYLWLMARLQPTTRTLREAALFLLPLLPLFFIAQDWGRWLVLWLSSHALFVLARRPAIAPISARMFWALFLFNLFWGQHIMLGAVDGGPLKTLLRSFGLV